MKLKIRTDKIAGLLVGFFVSDPQTRLPLQGTSGQVISIEANDNIVGNRGWGLS